MDTWNRPTDGHDRKDIDCGQRVYDFGGHTVGQLVEACRELRTALGFTASGSPVRVPILHKMNAIEDELAERRRSQTNTWSKP